MIRSLVRTFLVPRALQAHLARAVFVTVRRVFRLRASERHDYAMRDRVMALYAPVALLVLLAVWFTLVLAGYSAMFFALGGVSPFEAFTLAGSSMLTLGFAMPPDDAGVALSFTAAGLRLGLPPLLIPFPPRPPRAAGSPSRSSSPPPRACTGPSSDASAAWPSSRFARASHRAAYT